ncbi:MAG TPA: DUF1232 domain-containing protein [Anaerolineae bacterium]|nr:DUF1232 domain-containing protein [Anaerolineae bacterium]HQE99982.1 DUF1232 domain-containing protein [Anaerolineae bacterium]
MSIQRSGSPTPPSNEPGAVLSWLKDFFRQFQLAWRLLLDSRVPATTKIVPFLTLAYLLSPIDLVSDLAVGLGQLDDLAILFIGLRLFVDLCPTDLVEEHTAALTGVHVSVWKPEEEQKTVDAPPALPQESADLAGASPKEEDH